MTFAAGSSNGAETAIATRTGGAPGKKSSAARLAFLPDLVGN